MLGFAGTPKCGSALVSPTAAAAICNVCRHHCAAPSWRCSIPNSTGLAPRPRFKLEVLSSIPCLRAEGTLADDSPTLFAHVCALDCRLSMAVCTLLLIPSSLLYLTAKILSHTRRDYRQVTYEGDQPIPEGESAEPLLTDQQQ